MFTGIVRATGTIAARSARGGDARLTIASKELDFSVYAEGESIAVSGVCLTALECRRETFVADVSRETLALTTLGTLAVGATVNLEPSLAVGERLGGHLVSGHVDCIGTVTGRIDDARSVRLTVRLEPAYMRYIARKGSVALDGISLTVNGVTENGFDVNIIPHTMNMTTLRDVKVGQALNVEVDQVARYVERLIAGQDESGGVSRELLRRQGYE